MKTIILTLTLICAILFPKLSIAQTELLTNGDFEYTTWYSNWSYNYASDLWGGSVSSLPAYSGSKYVWLGDINQYYGRNNCSDDLYQTVYIPSNSSSCVLYFHASINTLETVTSVYDYMKVRIRNSSGYLLYTLMTLSNIDGDYGIPGYQSWSQYSVNIPSSLFGSTVEISFEFYTDASLNTIFRLDDVSLLAYSGTPPSNDNPCSATPISVGSSCNYSTYTNANATASSVSTPSCGNYLGGDVWFSVTVPASGHLIFDSDEGFMLDGAMSIYSGSCNNLTFIACDDDASANGSMPMIEEYGLTPYSTIYIRFWEYNNDHNGSFDLCVYSPGTPPTADFSVNKTNPCVNSSIQFTDLSSNTPTSWDWDFGDGTSHSSLKNPIHTYTSIGYYSVSLTATNTYGYDNETKTNYINVINCTLPPVADFTVNKTNPCVNTSIQFSDISTNTPTSWDWDFGDGSSNSTQKNPAHTYTNTGNYSITLTVSNTSGSDYETKANFINVINCNIPPVADFTVNNSNPCINTSIQFTDISVNTPTSWDWDFGDGSSHSYQRTPTHTYTSTGLFSVIFTATNTFGSDIETKANFINVANCTPPVADFAASSTDINKGDAIDFYDQSTNTPTSYLWKFYDGSSGQGYQVKNTKNPTGIVYNNKGTFSVSLIVTNDYGTDTKVKSNLINVGGTGINSNNTSSIWLKSYPNPIHDNLTLEFNDDLGKQNLILSIVNQIGQVVISETISSGTLIKKYDFSNFPEGSYLIHIICLNGNVLTQKVIKQ